MLDRQATEPAIGQIDLPLFAEPLARGSGAWDLVMRALTGADAASPGRRTEPVRQHPGGCVGRDRSCRRCRT